ERGERDGDGSGYTKCGRHAFTQRPADGEGGNTLLPYGNSRQRLRIRRLDGDGIGERDLREREREYDYGDYRGRSEQCRDNSHVHSQTASGDRDSDYRQHRRSESTDCSKFQQGDGRELLCSSGSDHDHLRCNKPDNSQSPHHIFLGHCIKLFLVLSQFYATDTYPVVDLARYRFSQWVHALE